MKTIKKNTNLGLQFTFNIPSDVEEFDRLAGKAGALFEEGINNILYRRGYPTVWEAVANAMHELHKVPFKTKPHPKKAGETVVAESYSDYVERVMVEKGFALADLQAIADKHVCTPELTASARTPATVKPSKQDVAFVQANIGDAKTWKKVCDMLASAGFPVPDKATVEQAASVVSAWRRAEQAKVDVFKNLKK